MRSVRTVIPGRPLSGFNRARRKANYQIVATEKKADAMDWSEISIIIVVQFITFLVLVLVLRRIMFSAFTAELRRLRELNAESQKKSDRLSKELERAEREQARKMEKADSELKELRTRAREEAEKQKEELLRKAREEGERIVKQALGVKDRIRSEVQDEMHEGSIQLACRMVQEVFTSDSMQWLHENLVQDFLQALSKVDAATFKGIEISGGAVVHTQHELAPASMERLEAILNEHTGQPVPVRQTTDKDVAAGITLVLGSLVIDGSLTGKLRQAATEASAREA